MRTLVALGLVAFGWSPLFAQAPGPAATPAGKAANGAAAPAIPASKSVPGATQADAPASPLAAALPPQVQRDDVGFSYSLPADWELVAPPPVRKAAMPYPALAAPIKGDACVELAMTAKHGAPTSVVVVLALPFACYGQTLTASDLASFGAGAAGGMKQAFEITEPVEANYSLGSHTMWIERAKGTPKHRPENPFTFEIACTVLKKGAACWMAMAADAAALEAFELGTVSLEGEAPAALVPATAFLPDKPL
jgi:hypothetical protein